MLRRSHGMRMLDRPQQHNMQSCPIPRLRPTRGRIADLVGAWHGKQLIGFARAVTDGVQGAYVEDVIVIPSRRRSGIGQAMLSRLIQELGTTPLVTLFCSPDLVRYYEANSFRATSQVVMHRSSQ